MDDPDVIVGVDPDADGLAEHPVIRQRLGPQRIHFEARRLHAPLLCAAAVLSRIVCVMPSVTRSARRLSTDDDRAIPRELPHSSTLAFEGGPARLRKCYGGSAIASRRRKGPPLCVHVEADLEVGPQQGWKIVTSRAGTQEPDHVCRSRRSTLRPWRDGWRSTGDGRRVSALIAGFGDALQSESPEARGRRGRR